MPKSNKNRKKSRKRSTRSNKIVDPPFSRSLSKGTLASPGDCCGIDYTEDYHYQSYENVVKFIEYVVTDTKSRVGEVFTFNETSDAFLDVHIGKGVVRPMYVNQMEFEKNVRKGLRDKSRFIPIIVNLTLGKEDNHANILVINKHTKQIELFEPHGARTSSSELGGVKSAYKKKIKILRKFFKEICSYKLINVTDSVKESAFQMTEDPQGHSGFCVTWSILYFHYRILNPDVSLSELVRYIHHKITERYILRYARYIEELVKKFDPNALKG
jgi:hypothetical protein